MSTEKKDEVKQLAKKHKMKELEVVAARLAFSKYDKDSNGQLDRAEIENVIQETQVYYAHFVLSKHGNDFVCNFRVFINGLLFFLFRFPLNFF